VSGKAKGAAFERYVCKELSKWLTQGKRQDVFWRSAMSGGRATIGRRSGLDLSRQAGDICAVAPEGHSLTDVFYIECKHLKNIGLIHLMTSGGGRLLKLAHKTIGHAEEHGRQAMLILRQNLWPDLVIVFGGDAFIHDDWRKAKLCTVHHDELPDMVVLSFERLLKCRYGG
jgi:hypothetical protein